MGEGRAAERWRYGGMPGDYFVERGIALGGRVREREGNGQKRNKRLGFDLKWIQKK